MRSSKEGDMKDDYIIHWGIKGQRWGRRRFQNEDGSLTAAGKKRYGNDVGIASDRERTMPTGSTGGLYNKPRLPKYAMVDGPPAKPKTLKNIVDEFGKVKMSYFRGKDGDRYIAAGKDYVEKHINIDDYFYKTKNLNIEYGVYND
jgi:hypothetical protein